MLEGSDDFFQRKTAIISRYIPPGSGHSFRLPATAMTSPAPSDKGMRPSAHGIFPSTTISSWKFNELARILTNNSSGLGLGGSSSTNLRFSNPPGALSLTSLMNIRFFFFHSILTIHQ